MARKLTTDEVERKLAAVTAPPRTPMDLRLLGYAGHRRAEALEQADRELEVIAEELVRVGNDANVTLAAKLTGVSRTTLYARMQRVRESQAAAA